MPAHLPNVGDARNIPRSRAAPDEPKGFLNPRRLIGFGPCPLPVIRRGSLEAAQRPIPAHGFANILTCSVAFSLCGRGFRKLSECSTMRKTVCSAGLLLLVS